MNDGMFLFKSFADTLRQMNDKDRLEAMDAIITYGVYGENPKLADGSIASMFFTMAKPVIDANNKQRSSGSKGGTNESSKHPSTNPTSTLPKNSEATLQESSKHPSTNPASDNI